MRDYFTPPPALREIEAAAGTGALPLPPRKLWRYGEMKSMPRGIEMQEYIHADGSVTFIGQYRNRVCQPKDRPRRVYRVEVRKIEPFGELTAAVFEDDVRLVKLGGGTSKWNLAWAALGALRGILAKRCRQTRSNRRRLRAAASAATPERTDNQK